MRRAATTRLQGRPTRRIRIGAIVALAIAAGTVTWVAVAPESRRPAATSRPVETGAVPVTRSALVMSEAQLAVSAAAHRDPVYWAGPRPGLVFELTETAAGRVFVRYLEDESQAGSPRADFLTVATYPQANSYAQVQAAVKRPGAVSIELAGGGLAVYDRARPTSIYLAYPGGNQQIELYHPNARQARRLVRGGAVRPVG